MICKSLYFESIQRIERTSMCMEMAPSCVQKTFLQSDAYRETEANDFYISHISIYISSLYLSIYMQPLVAQIDLCIDVAYLCYSLRALYNVLKSIIKVE